MTLPFPPYGMGRETAAAYVDLSPATFDKLVKEGKMPAPVRVGVRKIWLRDELEAALKGLRLSADDSGNPWDEAAA